MARHGVRVRQGECFPGCNLRYPGDINGSAAEVINCHCYLQVGVLLPGEELDEDGRIVKGVAMQAVQAENGLQGSGGSGTITVLTEKEAAAEKDLRRQKTSSIKKSIATLEKRIEQHKQKIAFPAEHDTTWGEKTEGQKRGLLKHWEKETNNFRKSLMRRETELKRRGEQ